MNPGILVIHGDADCRHALRTCLQPNGYDVAVLYEPGRLMAGTRPPFPMMD